MPALAKQGNTDTRTCSMPGPGCHSTPLPDLLLRCKSCPSPSFGLRASGLEECYARAGIQHAFHAGPLVCPAAARWSSWEEPPAFTAEARGSFLTNLHSFSEEHKVISTRSTLITAQIISAPENPSFPHNPVSHLSLASQSDGLHEQGDVLAQGTV